ncbi:MAG: serine/threonine protein kinase [Fuerstia sp.]|nr:serine/threonine protein kinase [Fuerstiella sp.]
MLTMSLDPTHIPDQPYDSDVVNRARNLLEAIPENIGPYRILERIGTGGMGEVYRAEQRTPIRREVALKLIKLGMDTKLVIARFEAERQALALMDHPHIAKVFDASADETGRPYFVMEYVKGKPITEYADHQRLSIPERLELFEQVCQAVQHAHHKGVIHRDLKPSNVLVCTQDGKPFSKVIDFGVAKAIVQRLTEKTFFTEHGQFVGTPHYMSPEQAEGSIDIDTRTDVYSLGVLLYELLTGSTPFAGDELRKVAFEQLKRMVIEVDPPKPSTRLLASSASRRASVLGVHATAPRANAQRLADRTAEMTALRFVPPGTVDNSPPFQRWVRDLQLARVPSGTKDLPSLTGLFTCCVIKSHR